MMQKTFLFFCWLLLCNTLLAQTPAKYWVQFSDKAHSPYSIQEPEKYLSMRAIERRQRMHISITEQDLPVNQQYIDSLYLIDTTMVLLTTSKWFNAVTIYTETDSILGKSIVEKIKELPFVKYVECTALPKQPEKFNYPRVHYQPPKTTKEVFSCNDIDYGNSFYQVALNGGNWLHQLGVCGEGMRIAVFDAGFENVNTLPQFSALRDEGRLLGARNFVQPGRSVFISGSHGTNTLSCIVGYEKGVIVGTAPKASIYLAVTEDSRSENKVEEDNWVAAAEWADSLGCDVISSSLGYHRFDIKNQSYIYQDMNGEVSRASIAASIAATKGMLVCVSAGNEGNKSWKYLTAPADARGILTVGAVTYDRQPASFSSIGPTSDGRVKPEALAVGVNAIVVQPSGYVSDASGTSFAAPLLCGMATCLWQLFPSLSNDVIIKGICFAGSHTNAPTPKYGYGIPNMVKFFQQNIII